LLCSVELTDEPSPNAEALRRTVRTRTAVEPDVPFAEALRITVCSVDADEEPFASPVALLVT